MFSIGKLKFKSSYSLQIVDYTYAVSYVNQIPSLKFRWNSQARQVRHHARSRYMPGTSLREILTYLAECPTDSLVWPQRNVPTSLHLIAPTQSLNLIAPTQSLTLIAPTQSSTRGQHADICCLFSTYSQTGAHEAGFSR